MGIHRNPSGRVCIGTTVPLSPKMGAPQSTSGKERVFTVVFGFSPSVSLSPERSGTTIEITRLSSFHSKECGRTLKAVEVRIPKSKYSHAAIAGIIMKRTMRATTIHLRSIAIPRIRRIRKISDAVIINGLPRSLNM